jgi:hypothetical protein
MGTVFKEVAYVLQALPELTVQLPYKYLAQLALLQ